MKNLNTILLKIVIIVFWVTFLIGQFSLVGETQPEYVYTVKEITGFIFMIVMFAVVGAFTKDLFIKK